MPYSADTPRQLLQWIWRAWPVLVIVIIFCVHQFLLRSLNVDPTRINETVALLLQITGGGLILVSIDSNIGIIRGGSLLSVFRNYLRDFPLRSRSYVLDAQGASHIGFGGRARTRVTRTPQTVQEQIAYLQEQVDAIRRDSQEDYEELKGRLEKLSGEMRDKVASLSTSVQGVQSKIDQVSVGSLKVQILGALLVLYGAISAYVA